MLIPAIHFPGTCLEAIELYKKAFSVTVKNIAYNRDAPADSGTPQTDQSRDKIMHAELEIDGSPVNMCDVEDFVTPGNLYLFNIFMETSVELAAAFHILSEGGKVYSEPHSEFFAAMYTDFEDRFGVHWQLMANRL